MRFLAGILNINLDGQTNTDTLYSDAHCLLTLKAVQTFQSSIWQLQENIVRMNIFSQSCFSIFKSLFRMTLN